MNMLMCAFIILSVIFLLMLLSGEIFIYKDNVSVKTKCDYSVQLAICLFLYLLSIIFLCAGAVVTAKYNLLIYSLFAISPFVIGKFSNYEHIKFYTNIQILTILAGIILGYFSYFSLS